MRCFDDMYSGTEWFAILRKPEGRLCTGFGDNRSYVSITSRAELYSYKWGNVLHNSRDRALDSPPRTSTFPVTIDMFTDLTSHRFLLPDCASGFIVWISLETRLFCSRGIYAIFLKHVFHGPCTHSRWSPQEKILILGPFIWCNLFNGKKLHFLPSHSHLHVH